MVTRIVTDYLNGSGRPLGLTPTPTLCGLPRRFADFATLGEALDYVARGSRGLNYHDHRAELTRVLTFAELREQAHADAARLRAAGVQPGDRVAMIAETTPEFHAAFLAGVLAGAWPAPLPLPTSFGGRDAFVDQIANQIASCEPTLVLGPADLLPHLEEAAARTPGARALDWDAFHDLPAAPFRPHAARPDDVAFLQYSSGSTRFPHGVMITHANILNNNRRQGLDMDPHDSDRIVSWLPMYHDMGLVGHFLCCVANQISADYLSTEDFARRPLAWLTLISRNEGTSCAFSPTFGYDICARRVGNNAEMAARYDLSRWRVAGNGADMIRPDVMQAFIDSFAPSGFKATAFLPSYGLAEATLALSLMPAGTGIQTDLVDERRLLGEDEALPLGRAPRLRPIVNCGKPIAGHAIEVRGKDGAVLPEEGIGRIFARGPSIMKGYFRDPEATAAVLSPDGWLDTGDMGYMKRGFLYIVGRAKDMIIINGRNYWPQDIEWAIEQLPGFKSGDIAAFAITDTGGEELPAVLVQCRVSEPGERARIRDEIKARVRAITGMNCVVELVPPRTLPRTSSGKLSRTKARNLYLSGAIQTFDIAA
jgi:fatty-acyl-CoA synthase